MSIRLVLFFIFFFNKSIFAQNADGNTQSLADLLISVALKLPNSECKNQLISLGNGFSNGETWALQMLDATAKPQAGILLGNIMHIGNYDECLEINEKVGGQTFQGKYCTAFFQGHPKYGEKFSSWIAEYLSTITKVEEEGQLAVAAKFSYGFCVPKVCTAINLQNLTDILENEAQLPVHFSFDETFCDGGDPLPYTTSAIVAIVIFALFGLIIVLSSFYDYFICSVQTPSLLTAFSVVTNGKKLISTATSEGNLDCLNGLRVISMMWIILAHGFQYSFFVPHVNGAQMLSVWKNSTENAFIAGSSISVDTFFTISGLLVVYLYMKSQAKGVRFNLPMFYIHRILRLTPSLVMVMFFTMTLINYMGNGPFWPIVDDMLYKPCEKNWWSTLIYLQNYIHPNEQCVGQAWYLAVDTQMYFLSPLIFFPLVKWPKQTIGAIIVFIVLNCSYVFEITWKKHLGATFFDQDDVQYRYIYAPTHIRGTVYLMGMVCGYYIYKTRTSRPLKLCKWKVLSLWIFSLLVLLIIVLGHSWLIQAPEYNVLNSSFFNSLTRVGWSLAVSIIIILCVNGYGGFINSFLSSKIFTVLIRLNYNVYLVHLALMMIMTAQERTPTYFANRIGFHQFWGDYIFSLGAAVIWTLAFESPVLAIEKIIFGGKPKSSTRKTDGETQNGKSLEGIKLEMYDNGVAVDGSKAA